MLWYLLVCYVLYTTVYHSILYLDSQWGALSLSALHISAFCAPLLKKRGFGLRIQHATVEGCRLWGCGLGVESFGFEASVSISFGFKGPDKN